MNIIKNIKIILEVFSPTAKDNLKRFGIAATGATTGSIIGHHIVKSNAAKKIGVLFNKIQQYK